MLSWQPHDDFVGSNSTRTWTWDVDNPTTLPILFHCPNSYEGTCGRARCWRAGPGARVRSVGLGPQVSASFPRSTSVSGIHCPVSSLHSNMLFRFLVFSVVMYFKACYVCSILSQLSNSPLLLHTLNNKNLATDKNGHTLSHIQCKTITVAMHENLKNS